MAKSSASRLVRSTPGTSAKPGTVTAVNFRPATNGLISETHKSSKGDSYSSPEVTVHTSIRHALNHLQKSLGGAFDPNTGTDKDVEV